jgi:crotonobetainyl-CoA:carnitine CoA-transferase CaiB-like acyl-CoA transferase
LEEVVADEQLQSRNMFITHDHPTAGSIKMIGSPLKLSRTPVEIKHHPPNPGEHQEEIMDRIGMNKTTN